MKRFTAVTERRFCPECGTPHGADARFCEECGHRLDVDGSAASGVDTEAPTAVAPAAQSPGAAGAPPSPDAGAAGAAPAAAASGGEPAAGGTGSGRSPWPWIAAIVAILAAAGVGLALILGGDDDQKPQATTTAPGYPTVIARAIGPVGTLNDALSDRLGDLDTADDIGPVRRARTLAVAGVSTAQVVTGGLNPPVDDQALSVATARALAAERTLLRAMARAITSPSADTADGLAGPARAARAAWSDVRVWIPGAGGRIENVDRLAAWARAQGAGAAGGTASKTRRSCGGFEGIVGVVATGVDCTTALRVAANAVNGGAPGSGFSCRIGGTSGGLNAWACSSSSGATITFSATSDAAPEDTSPGQTPATPTPEDVPQETEDPSPPEDTPSETPDEAAPDSGGEPTG